MRMKIGFDYRITSTVLEFEPNRRITWAHLLGNRWSYELTALDGDRTLGRRRTTCGLPDGRRRCRLRPASCRRSRSPSPSPLCG
jgi:hypothetical protein